MTTDVFNARLAQANLIAKKNFDAKLSSLNRKITSNKSKHLLVQNELKKLKTCDSSYFIGKSYFEENDTQNYLLIQPMERLKVLLVLVMEVTFITGNLKDFLMKMLILLKHLTVEKSLFEAVSLTKNADILDMELDFIAISVFHFLVLD